MTYSIGEVAKMLNLSIPTLRYYDKEGLLPFLERNNRGIRIFNDSDLDTLKIVECLKATGMPIKDIKTFIDWCTKGDSTLQKRYEMFLERKAVVAAQMEEIKKTEKAIDFKCKYYKAALDASIKPIHKNTKDNI